GTQRFPLKLIFFFDDLAKSEAEFRLATRVSANREQRSISSSTRRLGFRRLGTRVSARANRRREDQVANGGTVLAPIRD
ncbi:hypothetical protein U1Q18_006713, partial [Sarracenia purpurea var. burkii]